MQNGTHFIVVQGSDLKKPFFVDVDPSFASRTLSIAFTKKIKFQF